MKKLVEVSGIVHTLGGFTSVLGTPGTIVTDEYIATLKSHVSKLEREWAQLLVYLEGKDDLMRELLACLDRRGMSGDVVCQDVIERARKVL